MYGGSKVIIKASASLRNDYSMISNLAKATKEPIYITKNGEGDLYLYSMSYEQVYMNNDFVLPIIDNETTQKVADVKTIADEFYANAISGVVDIDAEWDSYLAALDKAGLQDVLAAYEGK